MEEITAERRPWPRRASAASMVTPTTWTWISASAWSMPVIWLSQNGMGVATMVGPGTRVGTSVGPGTGVGTYPDRIMAWR